MHTPEGLGAQDVQLALPDLKDQHLLKLNVAMDYKPWTCQKDATCDKSSGELRTWLPEEYLEANNNTPTNDEQLYRQQNDDTLYTQLRLNIVDTLHKTTTQH